MRKIFLQLIKKHAWHAAGTLLFALIVTGVGLGTGVVYAADCDSNAVIRCGYKSPEDFIAKARANNSLNGQQDLQSIYLYFGMGGGDYDRFIASARPATFMKDGRVMVDGSEVASNAVSFGRSYSTHSGAGLVTVNANGTTLYGNRTSRTFASNSLSGHVLFDGTGTPQLMVIGSCANPVTGDVVRSGATCDMLNSSEVPGKLNTYRFTAKASQTGLANLIEYVYDFGDGSPTVTTKDPNQVVEHTYTKAGTFTAKLTAVATAPGYTKIVSTSETCKKVITVKTPYYSCIELGGVILNKDRYMYRFTASMKFGDGATFVSADFDFGDGKQARGIKKLDGNAVSAEHTYEKAGNYSVSATLHFSVAGATVSAPTCKALVTPTAPPTPECKPGVPVGDVRCTPCPYDANIPKDDERCVAPATTLPNTGAGNIIALGAVALVGGFLFYRHTLFRRHKRAYLAAEMGSSPLPLADPLQSAAPLAGTPLQPPAQAQRRRGFRRRQY
jgi:hypothetical protein